MTKPKPLPKLFPREVRVRPGHGNQLDWPFNRMICGDFFYIQTTLRDLFEEARREYACYFPAKRFLIQESNRIKGLSVVRREA